MSARVTIASLLMVLLALVAPRTARATGAAPPRLDAKSPAPVEIVEGAPPGRGNALGTAYVAWIATAHEGTELRVAEWDLASKKKLRERAVAHFSTFAMAVALTRSGDGLAALVSGTGGGSSEETSLFTLGPSLELRTTSRFANGGAPSLVSSGRYLVATTFEERAPLASASPHADRLPPSRVLVARVIDRDTNAIVGARVFRGTRLLDPATTQRASGHSVAIASGSAYFALPDREPRVIAARLPSLTTIAERDLGSTHGDTTSATIAPLAGGVVVSTAEKTVALAADLSVRGVANGSAGSSLAWDARSRTILCARRPTASIAGVAFVAPFPSLHSEGGGVAWLFGRPVGVTQDEDGDARLLGL